MLQVYQITAVGKDDQYYPRRSDLIGRKVYIHENVQRKRFNWYTGSITAVEGALLQQVKTLTFKSVRLDKV